MLLTGCLIAIVLYFAGLIGLGKMLSYKWHPDGGANGRYEEK